MIVQVENCQRCGQTHTLIFTLLDNPADNYAWWGMCPITEQPVLLQVANDETEGRVMATSQTGVTKVVVARCASVGREAVDAIRTTVFSEYARLQKVFLAHETLNSAQMFSVLDVLSIIRSEISRFDLETNASRETLDKLRNFE